VFFINENTGWVVGGDFGTERIFKTTNGGTNWIAQTSGTANKMFSVYFINENTGWSVGGPSSPKVIKTTNGGTTWFTQPTTISTPLYSVMFADANTGWAVAGYLGGETIIKTTNGGDNWLSQSSGDNRYLRECYVKDPLTAFAVGESGKLISTTNGGINWLVNSTGSSVELWSIDFANDSIGYAIGSTVVLKTTTGGITWISSAGIKVPESFNLYQNYPNPFNPVTKIKFDIMTNVNNENSKVMLILYNVTGQIIETLVNEELKPGSYDVDFDGSNYSSGIYFYELSVADYRQTRKFILIK
jgi:photosystem II stability/assembly factor-like uncharacterized protein